MLVPLHPGSHNIHNKEGYNKSLGLTFKLLVLKAWCQKNSPSFCFITTGGNQIMFFNFGTMLRYVSAQVSPRLPNSFLFDSFCKLEIAF